jgi:hypothetical protein
MFCALCFEMSIQKEKPKFYMRKKEIHAFAEILTFYRTVQIGYSRHIYLASQLGQL